MTASFIPSPESDGISEPSGQCRTDPKAISHSGIWSHLKP